jgi:hypothetical protein
MPSVRRRHAQSADFAAEKLCLLPKIDVDMLWNDQYCVRYVVDPPLKASRTVHGGNRNDRPPGT